jgi:hypothetical protein
MKVYFTCSVRGAETLKDKYLRIYNYATNIGYQHVINKTEPDFLGTLDQKAIYSSVQEENSKLYKDAIKGINSADIVILEITTHSLAMGFVMQQALNSGKPVIALYIDGSKPAFALSVQNEKLLLVEYNDENLEKELKIALENAEEQIDVRFNFFISPAIGSYLDWISKVKKIPRSVYLRALIEHEMRENKEYQN